MSEHGTPKPDAARRPAANRIQTKLHVSEPGDAAEREADAVAAHIVSGSRATASESIDHGIPAANRKPVEEPASAAAVHRAPTEKKPPGAVQRAPTEKKPPGAVQRAPTEKKPPGAVQRAGTSPVTDAHRTAAADAVANKGAGKPLVPAVREPIERGLGADLGAVRVHDDAAAKASAGELEARAFTHGSDIWLGEGESPSDLALMAHEATHVVQQGGAAANVEAGVARKKNEEGTVARAKKGNATKPAAAAAVPAAELATVDHKAKTIVLPKMSLPAAGNKATPLNKGTTALPKPFTIPKQLVKRTDQRDNWRKQITGPGVSTMVDKFLAGKESTPVAGGRQIFCVQVGDAEGAVIVGDRDRVKEQVKIPNWTRAGTGNFWFDVDHILELQLGGQDTTDNYQLLWAPANRSSGSAIKAELGRRLERGISAEKTDKGKPWKPDIDELPRKYEVSVKDWDTNLTIKDADKADASRIYTFEQVATKGEHLAPLKVLSAAEAKKRDLIGDPAALAIYKSSAAGKVIHHQFPKGKTTDNREHPNWAGIKGYDLKSLTYTPGQGGEAVGRIFDGHKVLKGVSLKLDLDEVAPYTVAFSGSSLRAQIRHLLHVPRSSPVEIFDAGMLDEGLGARGVLRPTLPFLKPGLELDLAITGEDVTLSKTFSAGEIALPSPISVPEASLTLSVGTRGVELDGQATIVIEGVATGVIRGILSTRGGLELEGQIDFDTELFDPARVTLGYREGEFSAKGELGIPAGRVRGIRSGHVSVTYAKGVFAAAGSVEPAIPGVQKAALGVQFSEAQGLVVSGQVALANAPGLSSGSLDVELKKPPGAPAWKVHAVGTAVPAIPGVNTTLTVTYDDGALTVSGSAEYSRGMLSGSLAVGVTNREFDAGGQPTDKIGDRLRVFGGGTVTARLAPWLEGRVGVRFLPNGEIELTGRIGLPSALQVFPEKSFTKNIFSINLDIPIIGFAVAGHRVGIFATIGGGLDLSAGIGPGELRDLGLEITYNPAHEDQTHVRGSARLVIPAHAGLRLFIRGALGAGIPIVSATLGLEVGAALGLEGAAEAGVSVDWSPKTGIALDAFGQIYVQPKFRFDLTGFLDVSADLLIKTIHLYEKRWELAACELGPDLRFGVRFPIHYQEGQPFDISWDQVQFDVPKVDTHALLGELIHKII